jgi:hypothetical protein
MENNFAGKTACSLSYPGAGVSFYLRWLSNKGQYSIFSQRKQILKEMRKRGKNSKRCKILLL